MAEISGLGAWISAEWIMAIITICGAVTWAFKVYGRAVQIGNDVATMKDNLATLIATTLKHDERLDAHELKIQEHSLRLHALEASHDN